MDKFWCIHMLELYADTKNMFSKYSIISENGHYRL